MANLTLSETASQLRESLRDYIEATYHISDEQLVAQRRELLDAAGVIHQPAYIESTPRYLTGDGIANLGLPRAATEILAIASRALHDGSPLVNDPPYQHQATSLTASLSMGKSLMVTTGTGSGKTECFLLPILGRLAMEAAEKPQSFANPGMRAILLYPMNALVNDQLGRLRKLFGHDDIRSKFQSWGGRPLRFARYTSRTLYPGVRTVKRDQDRLKPIGKYFVSTLRLASENTPIGADKRRLYEELNRRGKWPAKPDLLAWYGPDGGRWRNASGDFVRGVTLPDDPELLTRHEVLAAPPDVLVTNYSMLEYMLMRPLERPVFDQTRAWLAAGDQPLMLIVDEAHLYRGASGTEVALLIRRLRDRLGIPPDRLQVICTSASFDSPLKAKDFAAKLTGKQPGDFATVRGDLRLENNVGEGDSAHAVLLADVDLDLFYSGSDAQKSAAIQGFLKQRNVTGADPRTALYDALRDYPPMAMLKNETMQRPLRVDELGALLFPTVDDEISSRAATALVGFASFARPPAALDGPGILPSRLHAFFRGLPGLWVCSDRLCPEVGADARGGPTGRLYGQPRDRCSCGARVFELLTCRNCGTAYLKAFTASVDDPGFLWPEGGRDLLTPSGKVQALRPIDVLLEPPGPGSRVRPVELDLVTGRVDAPTPGPRTRVVYLPPTSAPDGEAVDQPETAHFDPCGICGQPGRFGRSPVQDHQTKGDEPFQAIVTRQVETQPQTAQPTAFAPLGGRKVLIFSDSRQTAARLAPNIQKYTTRDAVRPLLLFGVALLERAKLRNLAVADSYFAILLASVRLNVQLRPITRADENFERDIRELERALTRGLLDDADELKELAADYRGRKAPEMLVRGLMDILESPYYGLRSLGLATLAELRKSDIVDQLPDLAGVTLTADQRRAVVRTWLEAWRDVWFRNAQGSIADLDMQPETGRFPTRMRRLLGSQGAKSFDGTWLAPLLDEFGEPRGGRYFLRADRVRLEIGGDWAYCSACRTTQRPFPGSSTCPFCGRATVVSLDPDTDAVFGARKWYYRRASVEALRDDKSPSALVAAEHTAQLSTAQADDIFSIAEEHELLFQDVNLGDGKPAIDVLSCTTTMEVGIDIGSLSGVALRNMPPSRANYQQRAGRAGRRGRAVATVTSFAGSDSHDDHCFVAPDEVIRGPVIDPELSLDNWQIARRHLAAFVIQAYLEARVPPLSPQGAEDGAANALGSRLFDVLGTVREFGTKGAVLNRYDFRTWLTDTCGDLAQRAAGWLPAVGSSRVDLQACKLEYSIVSPK